MGGHGHGPVETEPVPHPSMHRNIDNNPNPEIGSKEHFENPGFWNKEPSVADSKPRSTWDRWKKVMRLDLFEDNDRLSILQHKTRQYDTWIEWMLKPTYPLKSELYTDSYLKPNPCPEQFKVDTYRWARFKVLNPKVPPPVDGKYNDYYHMLAFRNWFEKERNVYNAEVENVYFAFLRCMSKEDYKTNGFKNCRHYFNKYFAMSRAEEYHQAMLYMALTGNCAIRETPYPEDFVDQKRKIYDDWLFRTRHKRPSDDWLSYQ